MIEVSEASQNVTGRKVIAKKGCSDCENAEICKYRDEFTDYTSGLETMDLPEVLVVEVSCKYYKGEPRVKRLDMQGREYSSTNPSIMIRKGHKGEHFNREKESH